MAKKLYFDIETIPAGEEWGEKLGYLHERYLKKQKDRGRAEEDINSYEEFLDETGFDGAFGRIICIAYALDDEPLQVLSGDEKKMLEDFWNISANIDMFVGHNVRDFDLPFILQRSTILGVKPTWQLYEDPGVPKYKVNKFLDMARYRSCPIFDTQWEWSRWVDKYKNKTLEHIALAMGIPTPKEGIDGSEVYNFYKAGKIKEICDYCIRDVDTTRRVYKRMTFQGQENLPF
jgi:predicted PolB exonuclease-like 3'-5' exonuclease